MWPTVYDITLFTVKHVYNRPQTLVFE